MILTGTMAGRGRLPLDAYWPCALKALRNEIDCSEATLKVGYAEPALPLSIASGFMPKTTVVQTLEINDELLITFWPGEPVVELGLEMRRRGLAAGYRKVFNVGLANDYLMYFVPRTLYHNFYYEAAQNYYGPEIADWFLWSVRSIVSGVGWIRCCAEWWYSGTAVCRWRADADIGR